MATHLRTRAVMLRFLPGPEPFVWLTAETGLHVFRLVRRYNWCLSDSSRRKARWRRFWPRISHYERSTLFFLLKASGCPVGRHAYIGEVPEAFVPYARSYRLPALTETIKLELALLLTHVERNAAGAIPSTDMQWLQ